MKYFKKILCIILITMSCLMVSCKNDVFDEAAYSATAGRVYHKGGTLPPKYIRFYDETLLYDFLDLLSLNDRELKTALKNNYPTEDMLARVTGVEDREDILLFCEFISQAGYIYPKDMSNVQYYSLYYDLPYHTPYGNREQLLDLIYRIDGIKYRFRLYDRISNYPYEDLPIVMEADVCGLTMQFRELTEDGEPWLSAVATLKNGYWLTIMVQNYSNIEDVTFEQFALTYSLCTGYTDAS